MLEIHQKKKKSSTFKNIFNQCIFLASHAMNEHVKINYGLKIQDCTPLTSGVILKFSFRSL